MEIKKIWVMVECKLCNTINDVNYEIHRENGEYATVCEKCFQAFRVGEMKKKRYGSGEEIRLTSEKQPTDWVAVSDHVQSDIGLRADQSDYYFSPSMVIFRQDFHGESYFYEAIQIPENCRMNPSHIVE